MGVVGWGGKRRGESAAETNGRRGCCPREGAPAGLLEQIKEWPVGGGGCVVSPDRGNSGCTAGSLRDQQAQGHVDFIGFHSFSSEYLLCFCAFVIRPAQAHTHMHTDIHLSMLPLSLSAGMGIVFMIDVPHSSDVVAWLTLIKNG